MKLNESIKYTSNHIILCCTICACYRGKVLTGGCRYALHHRGYTSLYCNAVMKSIHSLFVMTPEIWAHSHVSPLTPLLQLVNDFTWRLHTRKIHESLGDHSTLRNVMWMEFDWLKRRSRIVLRLNGSVLNCFNRWCHLLLLALPWHQCHCHVHTMQHHLYTFSFTLAVTFFFITPDDDSPLAHPSSSLFHICKTFKMKNLWMDVFSSVCLWGKLWQITFRWLCFVFVIS